MPKKPKPNPENRREIWKQFSRQIVGALLILLVLVGFYTIATEDERAIPDISLSQLAQDITAGKVTAIAVQGDQLEITYQPNEIKRSQKEVEISLTQTLAIYGVPPATLGHVAVTVKSGSGFGFWILNLLPILFYLLHFLDDFAASARGFDAGLQLRPVAGADY